MADERAWEAGPSPTLGGEARAGPSGRVLDLLPEGLDLLGRGRLLCGPVEGPPVSGGKPTLIKEDQPGGDQGRLSRTPALARNADIRPGLFLGEQDFF